jgi:hypothetical protein
MANDYSAKMLRLRECCVVFVVTFRNSAGLQTEIREDADNFGEEFSLSVMGQRLYANYLT